MKTCLVLLFVSFVLAEEDTVIETKLGRIEGTKLLSWTGKEILAFRGFRYVQAPLGDLRFKPPVPVEKWNGTLKALEDGPVCPQIFDFFGPASEDCLFMNLFTKPENLKKKVPVIVLLHPGGYYSQTSRSDFFGPQYLLDHDLVFVTFNYRLGPVGYLSTQDEESFGNQGFKDQVEALRWVRDNIAEFGGDPQKVTLAGYSVGSTSVLLHMVSPMSKGLFQKAIAMSGGLTSPWVLKREPALNLTRRVGKLMACDNENTKDLIDCLRSKPAQELADTYTKLREWFHDPVMLYGVEKELDFGQERFMTEDPLDIIRSGRAHDVPLVIGITKNEFDARGDDVLSNEKLREELDKDFERIAPIAFYYERGTNKSKEISRNLRKLYFNNKPITENSTELGKMYSDGLMISGVQQSAKLFAKYLKSPVYFYMSSYRGRFSHAKRQDNVAHLDDLIYLFHISKRFPLLKPTDPEGKMVEICTSFWSNFAHKGDPTPNGVAEWKRMKADCLEYFNFEAEPTMVDGLPFKDRVAIWDDINPIEL